MQDMIIHLVEQFGYIGIILLIAFENIFPPIPSEVILTFSGFLTTYTSLSVWGVIFAATIGSYIGALFLYYVGRLLSKERLMKLVDGKAGRLLRFKREDVELTLDWFGKKGTKAVFFCRCIPILRSLISIPAGMAKMVMGPFTAMTVGGTLLWNILLVHLGAFAGASWDLVIKYMDTYKNWTIIILIGAIVIVCAVFARRRRRKKAG